MNFFEKLFKSQEDVENVSKKEYQFLLKKIDFLEKKLNKTFSLLEEHKEHLVQASTLIEEFMFMMDEPILEPQQKTTDTVQNINNKKYNLN